MSKACLVCARGFHEECLKGCKEHDDSPDLSDTTTLPTEESSDSLPPTVKELYNESLAERIGQPESKSRKRGVVAEGLKDPKSTGRKRAARLYPIDPDADCEWRGKKNCGGGRVPIIGCIDGKQVDRHHGPVKNTTRNYQGNVHRICKACHNHWHELNDLIYDELDYGLLPHDPVAASEEELVENLRLWLTGEIGKKYKLASTENMSKHLTTD